MLAYLLTPSKHLYEDLAHRRNLQRGLRWWTTHHTSRIPEMTTLTFALGKPVNSSWKHGLATMRWASKTRNYKNTGSLTTLVV